MCRAAPGAAGGVSGLFIFLEVHYGAGFSEFLKNGPIVELASAGAIPKAFTP